MERLLFQYLMELRGGSGLINNILQRTRSRQVLVPELRVRVQPNPSTQYFNLIINSSSATLVIVKVVDVLGRIIETKTVIGVNQSIRVGENNAPGFYFAQVMQGSEKIVVKLLKQ